jgi:hypothetical protein
MIYMIFYPVDLYIWIVDRLLYLNFLYPELRVKHMSLHSLSDICKVIFSYSRCRK